ncbi:unnamed protein product [Gadus morhua 'NCC']
MPCGAALGCQGPIHALMAPRGVCLWELKRGPGGPEDSPSWKAEARACRFPGPGVPSGTVGRALSYHPGTPSVPQQSASLAAAPGPSCNGKNSLSESLSAGDLSVSLGALRPVLVSFSEASLG